MMRRLMVVALIVLMFQGLASAEVVISEVMYNPASSERRPVQTEWLELHNAGNRTVDLSGHYLQDEDGRTAAFPKGTALAVGEALVVIPDVQTVERFHAAWGEGITVIAVDGWGAGGMGGLANSPSDTNEVLTLRDSGGEIVDEVNYDDANDWPRDSPDGASIYLKPGTLSTEANDSGKSWARSTDGAHDARACEKAGDFGGEDVGSPGAVVAVETAAAGSPSEAQ